MHMSIPSSSVARLLAGECGTADCNRLPCYPAAVSGSLALLAAVASATCNNAGGPGEGIAATEQALTTDYAAYWRLDELSGMTAADALGHYAGQLAGGPAWTTGHPGTDGGLSFDGVDDQVSLGDVLDMGVQDWTVAAWVKVDPSATSYRTLIAKDEGWIGWDLHTDATGHLAARLSAGAMANVTATSPDPLPTGVWVHVAAVYDRSANLTLYVNGTPGGAASIAGADGVNISNDLTLYMGRREQGESFFKGVLDDVRVYRRALSDAEVLEVSCGPTCQPIGYWRLNETSGPVAADSSGRGYSGQLAGGPTWTTGHPGTDGGLSFDGIDDQVSFGDVLDMGVQDWTVAAWVKVDPSATSYRTLIAKDEGWIGWDLHTDATGHLAARLSAGAMANVTVTSPDPLPTGVWVHVAAVYDRSANLTLYVNGTPGGAASIAGTDGVSISNDLTLYMGRREQGESFFKGALDDVRVYNRALSGPDVGQLSCGPTYGCARYSQTPAVATQSDWDAKFTASYGSSIPGLDGDPETFAWHGHYWVRAYLSMARTYSETKYLDRAVTTIDHWFANSDPQKGWGVSLGNAQQFLDTAMIAHAIMYFVYEVWSVPAFSAYRATADTYLSRLEPMVHFYDYEWIDNPPLCGSPGFYRYATCGPNGTELCGTDSLVMYNQGATMAKTLLLIDLVERVRGQTPDPGDRHKAAAAAAYFHRFTTLINGTYTWQYGGCRTNVDIIEDVSHGHLDLSLLVWAYRFGVGGISYPDMSRLASTLSTVLNGAAGPGDVSLHVDGTGLPASNWDRVPVGYDWIDLCEYDPGLLDQVIGVYNTHVVDEYGSRFFLGWAELQRVSRCVPL